MKFQIKELAMLAMLTAVCVAGRIGFQFMANIQPFTAVLLIITLYLGFKEGIVVGLLSLLLTNFYLGMGVWTIAQFVTYIIIISMTGLLGNWSLFRKSLILQGGYACISGFLYGFVISAVQAPFFGISAFWPYYLAGLPFDLMHSFGNIVFYLILAPVLGPILIKRMK